MPLLFVLHGSNPSALMRSVRTFHPGINKKSLRYSPQTELDNSRLSAFHDLIAKTDCAVILPVQP